MYNAEFFGTFDLTALVLTTFTVFFLGLILYLRREDRREGYPLEDDVTGRREPGQGLFFVAQPKVFNLPEGRAPVAKPDGGRDGMDLKAYRASRAPGTPLQPSGDPMLSGMGPGAYANRATVPDRTDLGELKVTPLRDRPDFSLDGRDPDPRGMVVLGADKARAGVVTDVWIDRGEFLVRYLEVALDAPSAGLTVVGAEPFGRRVLLPMTMAVVSRAPRTVKVAAILGAQFADVPTIASPDQVTRDEEERIQAYYGGGFLYATPARSEPWL